MSVAKPLAVTKQGTNFSGSDARRLVTAVFVAWMVVGTAVIWLGTALYFDYVLMSLTSIAVGFGGVGCIVFAKLRRPTLAKSTLLALSNIGIFAGSIVVHPSANVPYIFATFIGAPFLYFSLQKEARIVIFFAATAILTGSILSIIDTTAFGLVEVNAEIAATIIAPLTWFTTVSFILAEFAFFVLQAERYQDSLILANQETQKAAKAKSDFLANMSHEIRTPMNGVVGMVEILDLTKLDENQKEMTGTIRDSSFALLRIVDDILDSSKIETGQLSLATAPMNLRREVNSVIKTVSETARKRSVKVSVEIRSDTPQWIKADAGRLKQILLNILSNAIKFASGPEKAGNVRVNIWPGKAGGIRFLITDNGVGMGQ